MQPGQVVAYPPPAPAVQMQVLAPPAPQPGPSKYSCGAKSLGILQIVLTGVSVAVGIVNILFQSYLSFIASPIWGGLVFYLPAGILGIVSVTTAVSKRRCQATGCMVMSILAACIAAGNIICAGISLSGDTYWGRGLTAVTMAMDSILIVVSLAELVIAIVASVYCCLLLNELPPSNTTTIVYAPLPTQPNQFAAPAPPAYYPAQNAPNPLIGTQPSFAPVPSTAQQPADLK
ncbi:uncharacterized protein LOC110980801 [Acanthaster planci]|uniref:Uncharacterized protein LOC110980801 n=1 Tax=Acanthaster planci TaxID=133434 RepID=A0A8B7YPY1_ACAPL|nr:uncharacterized protein LOC110980801 [Acanthaster planci]